MDLSILNESQKDAVMHTDGPELIIAGAGSGKTRTLIHRIAYLIEEKKVNPARIVAVTFTNKAAQEMKQRAKTLVGPKAERVWISTFHSMCLEMLRETAGLLGYKPGFTISDDEDHKKRLTKVCKEFGCEKNVSEHGAAIANCKNHGFTPEEAKAQQLYDNYICNIYQSYQDCLKKDNVMDFDDLLMNAYLVLRDNEYVRDIYQSKCQYIMIDEFQDTNPIQFKLMALLAEQFRNICVVGDDDQSIYAFRGADVRNILEFNKNYPDAYTVHLSTNYRSTAKIVDAASEFIKSNRRRIAKNLNSANEPGAPIHVVYAYNMHKEADFIAQEIERLLKSGIKGKDIAVLYRTNNQSRFIEEALLRYRLPYIIVSGTSFYQRKEIKDIIAYLKTIMDGSDSVSVQRIINVPKRSIGASTIESYEREADNKEISFMEALRQADPKAKTYGKVHAFVETIDKCKAIVQAYLFPDALSRIIDEVKYFDYLRTQNESPDIIKSRVENVNELLSAAASFSQEYTGEHGMPELVAFLDYVALYTNADKRTKTEDKVTLMTLHASKGLEFPYVYIVALDDGLFPRSTEDDMEEARRLMYVGMTRAMKQLTLTHADSRVVYGKEQYFTPSRFIYEIPKEYMVMHRAR